MEQLFGQNEQNEMGSDGKWRDIIGPFYSSKGVLRRLGIDDQQLRERVEDDRILMLMTSDSTIVYPARQFFFNDDGVLICHPAMQTAVRIVRERVGEHLKSEWTIATLLFQKNDQGTNLLDYCFDFLERKEQGNESDSILNQVEIKLRDSIVHQLPQGDR